MFMSRKEPEMMYVVDWTVPTRQQLLPSMKFVPPTPAKPRKTEPGEPLASDRRLWPNMTVTWHQPRVGPARMPDELSQQVATASAGPPAVETCVESGSPLQPLTPTLSPEYRGEGEMDDAMPLTGFEAAGRDYPIDSEFELEQMQRWKEELKAETPKAQKNKRRQMVDDFAYVDTQLEQQRKVVVPTQEERDGFWTTLLLQELRPLDERTRQNCGTKKRTGRLPKITEQGRKFLLHALRIGASRQEIARRLEVHPSTITKFIQRDAALSKEVAAAEIEGRKFYGIYERLFYAGLVVVEPEPVVSTLFFEREKEYLIARGLPAEWVRRLRQRTGQEWYEALYAKQAAEKVEARIEKQMARLDHDDGKSQRGMKIVRRSFSKRNGQPVEEIRYVVENHRPGQAPSGEAGIWKDMQGMLEKLPEW
jgi:hypothetical protein